MNSIIELKEGYYHVKKTNIVFTNRDKINDLGNLIKNNHLKDEDMILIYDELNPFISKKTIRETIATTKEYDSVIAVTKLSDTIKLVDENNFVEETLNRKEYRKIQLRAIKYGLVKKIYENIKSNLLREIDNNIKNIILANTKW